MILLKKVQVQPKSVVQLAVHVHVATVAIYLKILNSVLAAGW